MRVALMVFSIPILFALTAPSAARADGCADTCRQVEAECRKDCERDAACLAECAEGRRICPEMCKAVIKGGGDRKKTEREVLKIIDEHDARQNKSEKQQVVPEQPHSH